MDHYLPLDFEGLSHAQKLGLIEKSNPPGGVMCQDCGSVVMSRWLHDSWHIAVEEVITGEKDGSRDGAADTSG